MTKRRRTTATEDQFPGADAKPKRELPTCTWTTEHRRCLMLATVWPGLSPHRNADGEIDRDGYCSWHSIALDSPALAEDFDEFERWTLALLDAGYCTEFLHHPPAYVWQAVRGHYRAPHERITARPCTANRCPIADLDLPPSPRGRVSPTEAKAVIRTIVDALMRKATP